MKIRLDFVCTLWSSAPSLTREGMGQTMNREKFLQILQLLSKVSVTVTANKEGGEVLVKDDDKGWAWGVQYGEKCNTPGPRMKQ